MATLRETRKRIASAKSVRKITQAMKLVSAAKSRVAQFSRERSFPYSEAIFELVKNLGRITSEKHHPILKKNLSPNRCFVLVTTDKGLCGGLLDKFESYLEKEGIFSGPADRFILIGKKGINILAKKLKSAEALFEIGYRKLSFGLVGPIIKLITDGYLQGKYYQVTVFYTNFLNPLKQEPAQRTILPVLTEPRRLSFKDTAFYEPDADLVLERLLPRYLEIQLYQLILESVASEHTQRMFAMDQATTNADEIIDEMTLTYNKSRQETITQELLEMTTTISAL